MLTNNTKIPQLTWGPTRQQRHWDWSSPSSPQDQRRSLVRAFLALERPPKEWDALPQDWDPLRRPSHYQQTVPLARVPTSEEVHTILEPWRPLRWREAAVTIWSERGDASLGEVAIWLRTNYGEGSDGKFKAWYEEFLDGYGEQQEDTIPWSLLDDANVFDFADEWERVFDVLPELTGPHGLKEQLNHRDLVGMVQHARARVQAAEDTIHEAEEGRAGKELQGLAVSHYLIVADREAWDTDNLRLLFLDPHGNIVRHSRIPHEWIEEWPGSWCVPNWRDSEYWEEGELGGKYRAGGEIGRALYGLDGASNGVHVDLDTLAIQ